MTHCLCRSIFFLFLFAQFFFILNNETFQNNNFFSIWKITFVTEYILLLIHIFYYRKHFIIWPYHIFCNIFVFFLILSLVLFIKKKPNVSHLINLLQNSILNPNRFLRWVRFIEWNRHIGAIFEIGTTCWGKQRQKRG